LINKKTFQRKILARTFIKKGTIIKKKYIEILRSSKRNALNANKLDQVIGKRAKINFNVGDAIKL
jgi:sialic acid synthase SpsE